MPLVTPRLSNYMTMQQQVRRLGLAIESKQGSSLSKRASKISSETGGTRKCNSPSAFHLSPKSFTRWIKLGRYYYPCKKSGSVTEQTKTKGKEKPYFHVLIQSTPRIGITSRYLYRTVLFICLHSQKMLMSRSRSMKKTSGTF